MDGLIPGRIVHYSIPDGDDKGQIRPAIVIKVGERDRVSLQVFTDGPNEQIPFAGENLAWVGSAPYASEPSPGCWTWPPVQKSKRG